MPSYLTLPAAELERRAQRARQALSACGLCGHNCGVDRLAGELGRCATGPDAKIASAMPHSGEEPPISGIHGSGTIFFSGCSLGCVFCQNWPISHNATGNAQSADQLAQKMLGLQSKGCHNINLVTPTHQLAAILEALSIAAEQGLGLPLVYNTSGFDSPLALELLDGIVDIYMPDIKYDDAQTALRLSGAVDYVQVNRRALELMQQQVGRLEIDRQGIAQRGLLVRHLVLPGGLSGERGCFEFLAQLDPAIYVSLMSQYFPAHLALRTLGVDRPCTRQELAHAREEFFAAGLSNGWIQDDERY
ncbi:MAG: radical SAM protein [Candidatus Alcyoniella australis]|nr:radical SAM protein [Candidatus Alcyoniella australis]